MVSELLNPLTPAYLSLKQDVLSDFFPWFWIGAATENPSPENAGTNFLGHSILRRPQESTIYPVVTSDKHVICNTVLKEIFTANSIKINSVLRINFNLTLPSQSKHCEPHYDHPFPHKNLLIYLNDSDGDTIVGEERVSPADNKIILFEGLHYHYLPKKGRRVVMVSTFI